MSDNPHNPPPEWRKEFGRLTATHDELVERLASVERITTMMARQYLGFLIALLTLTVCVKHLSKQLELTTRAVRMAE